VRRKPRLPLSSCSLPCRLLIANAPSSLKIRAAQDEDPPRSENAEGNPCQLAGDFRFSSKAGQSRNQTHRRDAFPLRDLRLCGE